MCDRQRWEKRVLKISLLAGVGFVILEVGMAFFSGSRSVLMDAVFDACELVVLLLSLWLTPLLYRPVTEKRPYGYSQCESIFVIIKSVMLVSVTVGLIAANVQTMLEGGRDVNGFLVSGFEWGLGVLSLLVLMLLRRMNRSVSSPLIRAEIYGWKMDFLCSFGVSAAFLGAELLKMTPLAWLAPYFDQLVAIILGLGMLGEPVAMVIAAFRDLFLFAPGEDVSRRIKTIAGEILSEYPYNPSFYEITRTGRRLWIAIYLQPREDRLSLRELTSARKEISRALSREYEDCFLELIPET